MSQQAVPIYPRQNSALVRSSEFDAFIGNAMTTRGYFTITSHDISHELIQRAFALATHFFNSSESNKCACINPDSKGLTGYMKMKSDAKLNLEPLELWQFRQTPGGVSSSGDFYPDNKWPDYIQGFQSVMLELGDHLFKIANLVLEACAASLRLPEDCLTQVIERGWSTLRLLKYPKMPATALSGSVRNQAHMDISLLTFLFGGTAEGLQVQGLDGEWIPIPAQSDDIIVVGGEMLRNISNGRLKSALHRILYPKEGEGNRITIPYFVLPRPSVSLAPLECFRNGEQPLFPEISAVKYLSQRLGVGMDETA